MNKRGQAQVAVGMAFEWAFNHMWVFIFVALFLMGLAAYFVSETYRTFFWWIISILWFIIINGIFIYMWYFIGKWIYVIIVNAKLFIQKAVGWILNIFE